LSDRTATLAAETSPPTPAPRWRKARWALPYLGLLIPVLGYTLGSGSLFWSRQIILIAIMSLVVVGLNISYGYAGEFALGQAAFYAVGAYVTGILASHGHPDLLITLPLSALAAAVIGLVSGIPGLRLGGWSLAMMSFFLILLIPDVVDLLRTWTGGFDGLTGIPVIQVAGHELGGHGYLLVVIVVATLVFAAARNLVKSRTGASLLVLRQSPILAASLGTSVYRSKLLAYVIGAIPAGIAGCLFTYLDGFIAPESFAFAVSVGFLAASILGGSRSIYGALVGAALLQLGPLRSTEFQQYSLVAYGAFLVLGGIFFAGGLAGVAGPLLRRVRGLANLPAPAAEVVEVPPPEVRDRGESPGRTLSIRAVTKKFGAVTALNQVTVEAAAGRVTAIIGANGSGKTTLLNLISGFYRPTSGEIRLGDVELTTRSSHRIARSGVARTFQTPTIPVGLTAAEVVATARLADHRVGVLPTILRLPKFRRVRRADREAALRVLHLLGLARYANVQASALPLGTRRLLEVARALARRPSLVLLDEPASGLDRDALLELADAIRRIRDDGVTVILVEHNFSLVLDLADTIHVLRRGELIASGTPVEIRHNDEVIASYLGTAV
jgi:branched-chain amino acid transport system permease protein